ncbi:MAG: hypothetical protein JO001_24615 [Alphaproteobacteria bacterium]|nr:hypothetical protein [Alphaproteobacteria bacterium]
MSDKSPSTSHPDSDPGPRGTGSRDKPLPPDSGDIVDDAERGDAATPLPHDDDIVGRPRPAEAPATSS